MERLTYKTLAGQGYNGYLLPNAPERVMQFGEGGFLRAFADAFIDELNERAGFNGKVVVVQPRGGHPEVKEQFQQQDGLYTLILRGREGGMEVSRTRIISCVSRCLDPKADWKELLRCAENPDLRFILSNTTEAGICFDPTCCPEDTPPSSFPAKLTAFLYKRYQLGLPGFWILPCELNDHNGDRLSECIHQYAVQWDLGEDFTSWLEKENHIFSTLVDRIVTGRPTELESLWQELGYRDELLDTGEVFASWVIEAPKSILDELPFDKADLPIQIVADHTPYKERKVRILNGAHTAMVSGAFLAGQDIVRDCMEDEIIRGFLRRAIYSEIIPTLDLPKVELEAFAQAVEERFNNPFIDHALLSIALNTSAKWQARVMPSLLEYVHREGKLPKCLTFSFAAYIAFYHSGREQGEGCLIGSRNGQPYEIKDDPWVLNFYWQHRQDSTEALVKSLVENERMWGSKLASLPGFAEAVTADLQHIEAVGMYNAIKECLA